MSGLAQREGDREEDGSLERALAEVGAKDDEEEKAGKRTSYYVEENEKLLNVLITNCEPILSEIVQLVDHFNSYNGIQRVIDRSQLFSQGYGGGGSMGTLEDISVGEDCKVLDKIAAAIPASAEGAGKALEQAEALKRGITANYSKLKNNSYIVGKMPGQKMQLSRAGVTRAPPSKATDDVVPEELEKKKRLTQLNESTYYSIRGTQPGDSCYGSLKNNVQTILGVKDT